MLQSIVEWTYLYECTPLARAFDLFEHLHEERLLHGATAESSIESGVEFRIKKCYSRQNGQPAVEICRRHFDRALATDCRICFVWDLVNARTTSFDDLSCILDASRIPTLPQVGDECFTVTYGLPRLLSCSNMEERQSYHIDWFSDVY